ncbi:MAG: hypothetical protein QM503_09970 [Bacteroidota bacterium]
MKRYFAILLLVSFWLSSQSQVFERQLGVRLGTMSGITGKVIKDKKTAIEGTLGFRNGGIQIYTLLETYKVLDKNTNQNWYLYFGGGAHVGYVNGYNRVRRWSNSNGYYLEEEYTSGPVVGLDAVMGVEYNFPSMPLTLFFEIKPLVELQSFNKVRTFFYDSGIGIVYRFME